VSSVAVTELGKSPSVAREPGVDWAVSRQGMKSVYPIALSGTSAGLVWLCCVAVLSGSPAQAHCAARSSSVQMKPAGQAQTQSSPVKTPRLDCPRAAAATWYSRPVTDRGPSRTLGFLAATCLLTVAALCSFSGQVEARTVQMPVGSIAVPVVSKGVVCGALAPGWSLEGDGRRVKPPGKLPADSALRQFTVRVASRADACANSSETVTLVATERWPQIDESGVEFYPDEGRVELRGRSLKNVQIVWQDETPSSNAGASGKEADAKNKDTLWRAEPCIEPNEKEKGQQTCAVPLSRSLRTDVELSWRPAHAVVAPDVVNFDGLGNRVSPARFRLRPARTVMTSRLVNRDGVDISSGSARVPLTHPESVAFADCAPARCEATGTGVFVRAVPGPAQEVRVRLRFAPRVYRLEEGQRVTSTLVTLPLLACPLSVVSGPLLRNVAQPRFVVRLDARCGSEAGGLKWAVSGEPARVHRVVKKDNEVYVLLGTERIMRDRVTITASRADGGIIGSSRESTVPKPLPRVSLQLVGHGPVTFIPTNRDATVSVAPAGKGARFVVVPVAGAYQVIARDSESGEDASVAVRGDANSGGFASLRFGYQVTTLPAELAGVNLAVISEPVQRQVRQASVPAPFSFAGGELKNSQEPLAAFVCSDSKGNPKAVKPGKPHRVPLEARESCRVIIHRERLRAEDGLQEVVLNVDVADAGGKTRPEVGIRERLVLRPGAEPKVYWIRGVEQFDRIVVSLSHVVDEQRYVLSPTTREGLPSIQWVAIIEGGRFRLYATAAIPSGLFRVNEPSGQIRLNFGVLSRLTMLDEFGKENLLGAEIGVMGMGLIPSRSNLSEYPPTLSLVAGIGVRVPLGSGAAVGVHGWFSYEFRNDFEYQVSDGGPFRQASRFAFIFGPSISIGNVGTNL